MKKHDWKAGMLLLLAMACIAGLSCSQYADMATPVVLAPEIQEYTGVEIPQWIGFTTLHFYKQEVRRVNIVHDRKQIKLKRLMQDDKLDYSIVHSIQIPAVEQAELLQGTIVGASEKGLSMLPGGAGLLTLGVGLFGGGAIGRKIKRPGDLSPEEVDAKIAKEKASA